jgi:hypothetical protein
VNISHKYTTSIFIVAEPDLFSLGMGKEAYWTLNSAKPSDEELDSAIDRIVSGIFSVCATLGSIPIIRCPPGTAAQAIASKLDRKLRDHVLNSKDNLFSTGGQRPNSGSFVPTSRPVLIILDRKVDLYVPLSLPPPILLHNMSGHRYFNDALREANTSALAILESLCSHIRGLTNHLSMMF